MRDDMDKKFIIVADTETAQKMINCGFQYISNFGDQYTFLNEIPKNFKFSEIDPKKYVFSNMLCV